MHSEGLCKGGIDPSIHNVMSVFGSRVVFTKFERSNPVIGCCHGSSWCCEVGLQI